MTGLEDVICGLAQSSAAKREPGDYEKDGLLYCGRCRTPKQCIADFGTPVIVGCTCLCEQEKIRAELAEQKRMERMMEIRTLRTQGIQDHAIRRYRFDTAEPSKNIVRCQRYVDRWEEMRRHNNGLLFWGGVGTGKTFAAACIANALIGQGYPALVTSLPKILNAEWDKSDLVRQMKYFQLMVLDDLGVERESDYSLEIVQFVVDERYKARLPLIITTNLTLTQLENPSNVRYARIYDRVLEMCVPVHFDGPSRRKAKAQDKMRFAREVFG